ncbi:hypothetical protein FBZ93_116164 [Bradyrhizobium macuxiense]|uniref:Uncharacterized protein n=1 Tax=Bradyrhizobium macuxiense TaxID=1755647 RepID=A0A560L207_9BRAD|nr:hypothetical protein [Bradyrhizobium macuxiense]TWB89445.1 hypothetical protein FBZ93_116164 [Bradyrhizobium macuxiense]
MKATQGELQALRLLRAFSKIDDEDKRKAVLEHVEAEAVSSKNPKKK